VWNLVASLILFQFPPQRIRLLPLPDYVVVPPIQMRYMS
jgi:hypothetical protein